MCTQNKQTLANPSIHPSIHQSMKSKLCFIFIAALFLVLVHSQSDKTSFNYDSFSPNSNGLTYRGSANVRSGFPFVRLTKVDSSGHPTGWSAGRVLYSRPVTFWRGFEQANFETTIRFIITPSVNGAADGITFFIAPVNLAMNERSSSGGNLGIFSGDRGTAPSVFAVEFDTFPNRPYDPEYRHIGIDIESRVSSVTKRFDSGNRQIVTANIRYFAHSNIIIVVASSHSQRASLSKIFNLRTILPQQVQVGISASTGGTINELGVHDIISWNFTSSLVRDAAAAYIPHPL